MDGGTVLLVVVLLFVLLVVVSVVKAVQIIPQAQAAVVERLGRYQRTLTPGLAFLVPFIDRIRDRIDLREQVVSFPPQPVITQDNLTVNIDTVVYYQVLDPKAAVYEISDYIVGVEQITITTLRNVVGGMSLEGTLTSRDEINDKLRGELDKATGELGDPGRPRGDQGDRPAGVDPGGDGAPDEGGPREARDRSSPPKASGSRRSAAPRGRSRRRSSPRRAAKQASILEAEADRQSRILRAQGERAAQYLQAQGEAKAIEKVFAAIKAGRPTPELLAYQYLQTLPEMAKGEANKVWMVPSDFGKALEGFTRMLGAPGEDGVFRFEPSPVDDARRQRPEDDDESVRDWFDTSTGPGGRPGRRGRGGAGPPAVLPIGARSQVPASPGRRPVAPAGIAGRRSAHRPAPTTPLANGEPERPAHAARGARNPRSRQRHGERTRPDPRADGPPRPGYPSRRRAPDRLRTGGTRTAARGGAAPAARGRRAARGSARRRRPRRRRGSRCAGTAAARRAGRG